MNPILSRLPKLRTRNLPLVIAGCGVLGLIFRLLITVIGLDGKGLMYPWHFTWICVWLMTIAAACIVILNVLPIRGPAAYRAAFPRSLSGAIGCALMALTAVGSLVTHFRTEQINPLLHWLQGGLFLLAAAAFVLVGLCRLFGKKPTFLFHVAICVYFALEMLNLYRTWSFDPQLHEYCFQLFACIALTGMAYQLAAFDMGRGSHRKLWAFGLTAVYLCCMSASDGVLFITAAIWAFTNLSNLRRPRQPKIVEAEETANQE